MPNISLLTKLAHLIEEILKAETPVAENVALQTASNDPKVQAVVVASSVLLEAAKNLKTATDQVPK
jgi:hypothetical protein